jgi:hypothetical protein
MAFVAMLGYAISGPIWWLVKFCRQMNQKAKDKKKNKQAQQFPEREK